MRYHCLHIKTDFAEEWQKDVFDQTLCELGVDTIDGELYYIQSDVWETNSSIINRQLSRTDKAQLLSVDPCPDENWNAVWEAEHPVQELPMGIRIVPHCAFGAGHHETTSMMIEELINHKSEIANHKSFRVLDHGTGTGVLAIFAKRLGAERVVAVDIDEKSVVNARENAALNNVEIEVLQGDTIPLPFREGSEEGLNMILANIHRNILLANMPAYATALTPKGELWISGFYEDDCPVLQTAAEKEGLTLIETLARNEWRLMRYRKEEPR